MAAGSTHGHHIEEHVPWWWGIITVEAVTEESNEIDFYILRKAQKNPKMNLKRKLGLLWRPELAHIQEINGMAKYKEKSKAFVVDKILQKVPEELLVKQISEELFQRDYTEIGRIIEEFGKKRTTIHPLPDSLKSVSK